MSKPQRYLRLKASLFYRNDSKLKKAGRHKNDLINLFKFIGQSKNVNIGNVANTYKAFKAKYAELPQPPEPNATSFPDVEEMVAYFFAPISKGDFDERQVKHQFLQDQWNSFKFPDDQNIPDNPLENDGNFMDDAMDENMNLIENVLEFSQNDVFTSENLHHQYTLIH